MKNQNKSGNKKNQSSKGQQGTHSHKRNFDGNLQKKGLIEINEAYYTALSSSSLVNEKVKVTKNIHIATFNVLFDIYDKMIVYSSVRWKKQLQIFKSINADILSLSEVTLTYLTQLFQDDWIIQNYHHHICDTNLVLDQTGMEFGNLILSKFPIRKAYRYHFDPKLKFKRPVIIAIIEIPYQYNHTGDHSSSMANNEGTNRSEKDSTTLCTDNTNVHQSSNHHESNVNVKHHSILLGVISVHLKASENGEQTRAMQLEEIYKLVNEQMENGESMLRLCDELIILGDLNLMSHQEDLKYLRPKEYIDVWGCLKPNDPGYTFDGESNTLIQKLQPGYSKRMRLDRILLRRKDVMESISLSTTSSSSASSSLPSSSLPSSSLPSSSSSSLTKITISSNDINTVNKEKHHLIPTKINLFANKPVFKDPKRHNSYLYPSDHYGIICTFESKNLT